MPKSLTISRACEQRLQSGLTLTGAFQLECITRLHQAISDLGCVLEQMSDEKSVAILQDQIAACHEALCDLQNDAVRHHDKVRGL